MELSPEERRRIYEEEKARVEAEERAQAEQARVAFVEQQRAQNFTEPPTKSSSDDFEDMGKKALWAGAALVGCFALISIFSMLSSPPPQQASDSQKAVVAKPATPVDHFKVALSHGAGSRFESAIAELYLVGPKHKDYKKAQAKIVQYKGVLNARKEAAARKVQQEKQRLARAIGAMRKSQDDVRNVTWYYDRSTPHYINSRSNIYLYMGKSPASQPWLRFVISYVAEDWLFVDRYMIKADSQTFEIDPPSYGEGSIERDNNSGIWEWLDRNAETQDLVIAEAIANSRRAVIRYEGRQYYKDRVVSQAEKNAIKNVLAAKQALEAQARL